MKVEFGVFGTDQINKKLIKIPARELMRAHENHHRSAYASQVAVGTPSHVQHDMHRLIGWSRQLGHYIDGEMVRVLGCIERPENDEERAQLRTRAAEHRDRQNKTQVAPFRSDLSAKAGISNSENLTFLRMESVFVKKEGLAATLYPEFFVPSSDLVDKDGLVQYRELLARTDEKYPGIYHDKKRDIILVAHRFFRRRLSHLNSLNGEFLSSLSRVARENAKLEVRLRLDPDLIGDPASVMEFIELEYWRGPKYDDDISKIPNGVAEHKADEKTRTFEGVDRTQIWWKAPEGRVVDGVSTTFRTFELEELVEEPSPGLPGDQFGCRYAHAEYSSSTGAITHFDGAIRAYDGDAYLTRIDRSIDRAGKHSNYTKVFRVDGELMVPVWKRLLSDYFRGNSLILEYLGAPEGREHSRGESALGKTQAQAEAPLVAFISLSTGQLGSGTMLYPESFHEIGTHVFPFVEIGVGELSTYFATKHDKETNALGFRDGILNLSRFGIAGPDRQPDRFMREIVGIADALEVDVLNGQISRIVIPLMWENDDIIVTLTLAGRAAIVLDMLRRLPALIDLTKMPSFWIEDLARTVAELAPVRDAAIIWKGVERGTLEISRSGYVDVDIRLSPSAEEAVRASSQVILTD